MPDGHEFHKGHATMKEDDEDYHCTYLEGPEFRGTVKRVSFGGLNSLLLRNNCGSDRFQNIGQSITMDAIEREYKHGVDMAEKGNAAYSLVNEGPVIVFIDSPDMDNEDGPIIGWGCVQQMPTNRHLAKLRSSAIYRNRVFSVDSRDDIATTLSKIFPWCPCPSKLKGVNSTSTKTNEPVEV